jgi:hypothetical protein
MRAATYFLPERKPRKSFWFPKVKPHAPDTMQTPARKDLPRWGRVKQALWALGSRLREHDFKYAFKAGMATALLAAPAWFDATRPVFLEYRGMHVPRWRSYNADVRPQGNGH